MSTLTSAHFDLPLALLEGLQARFRSPPRAYHSWSHIEAMLTHFDEVAIGRLEGLKLDHDSAHFLDCDMAVLGAPAHLFDAYDRGVAEEYAPHVNAMFYRFGRRRFLSKLLDAKRSFFTDFFRTQLDEPARANLRRALRR